MRYRTAIGIGVILASVSGCGPRTVTTGGAKLVYPPSKTVDVVDDYHGVKVPDPYRWMEDLDSPDVKAWVEAQNRVTFGYLESIPSRTAIRKRITELYDFERFDVPTVSGGRYFFTRNSGLQNQSVLYVSDGLNSEPRVLLDPNTLSADGTVALSGTEVTDDGKLLAYAIARAGSDWNELYVRSVDTGKDLPDHIKWVKFSGISWTLDGSGFFYSRYDEPKEAKLETTNYYQKLYFHRLGTPQAEDRLIYDRPDQKEWLFEGKVTDDGRYLIIYVLQAPRRRTGCTTWIWKRNGPRSCVCWTSSTPSTYSSTTTGRSSGFAPTWTHRDGGWSRSTSVGQSRPTGKS